ncbi:hypothetical protein AAIE21_25275 [Paenibacillus sp. 102]|uniref:hypothetical protein n=1 Tax=Paenibacillus sp. 102 TaxID=3120823 RepID=UPI0031B9EA93
MYPKFFNKMAFSKEHKDLMIQLYNKEITRSEYNKLLNSLYEPTPKTISDTTKNKILSV